MVSFDEDLIGVTDVGIVGILGINGIRTSHTIKKNIVPDVDLGILVGQICIRNPIVVVFAR